MAPVTVRKGAVSVELTPPPSSDSFASVSKTLTTKIQPEGGKLWPAGGRQMRASGPRGHGARAKDREGSQ